MFIPAPFIRTVIIKASTSCPFELTQAAISAHTSFIEALNRHKTNAHQDYIIPTLEQATALPANANDTVDVLRQLGATMARPSEAAEAQNATQREQLNYMKEKDKKKKDKAEKFMDAAEVG
jgi:hypothetical protein